MYSQCALQNDRLCTVAVHLNNILCLYGQEYFYVRHFFGVGCKHRDKVSISNFVLALAEETQVFAVFCQT